MIKAKTICVKCQFHKGPRKGGSWHEHKCAHPETQLTQEQDPVTGITGYAEKNDLGRVYLTDNPLKDCRDINHGNCQYYEPRILP